MMIKKAFYILSAALIFSQFGLARAENRIEKIDWQVSRSEAGKQMPFAPLAELKLKQGSKYLNRLRAVVSIRNAGLKPVEGLVLKCALILRFIRPESGEEGFWAVPFHTEEVRVPRIKAGGVYEAKLVHFVLNEQLKKLNNTGFWVDGLKLQVMLDPRAGAETAEIMREAIIPITRP